MKFEHKVRKALSGLPLDQNSRVVVDSTRVLSGQDETVIMVSYHLEGTFPDAAQFTFPFVESVPLDEALDAFLDYGARNWQTAQFAPGEGTSRSAGAD